MKKVISMGYFLLMVLPWVNAQTSSEKEVAKNKALYTTYAADMARTTYRWDQGYHFQFYKEGMPLAFTSAQGGNIGLAFAMDGELRYTPEQMFSEPVITATYNDQVWYSYYPFKNIKVECVFIVYSSSMALQEVIIRNESLSSKKIAVKPFFYLEHALANLSTPRTPQVSFNSTLPRDNWMENHDIPLAEHLYNVFAVNYKSATSFAYTSLAEFSRKSSANINSSAGEKHLTGFNVPLALAAGDSAKIRIIRAMVPRNQRNNIDGDIKTLFSLNINTIKDQRFKEYDNIPVLKSSVSDYQDLYHSAFSLIRQCMMPPEGKAHFNYYVFSREPKWGWGYGGQVFHESLVMLAYAYMDPASAMNSQRVFMERQWPSGYINYRTGPYLDEQIEYNNQFTSSAPWFNYQNYEIYKISHDKKFLAEAYESGKAFYTYYVTNRDANNNGLAEWGAHAELESVRDARVAVWDRVGWPANFESPDLNAMLVMEANSLAAMARVLRKTDEATQWAKKAANRSALINKYLWDDKTGFYYNADTTDLDFSFKSPDDLKIMEIIGFIPLWAGVANEEQAARLVQNLTDEDKFWRRFGIPSLSAEDAYYNPIGYWNGPVWVQWQYLIFRGLIDYGYNDLAVQLAEKVLDNIIYHLKKDHTFWEFYSADDYQAGWNKTYIWTGIAARFLIDMEELKHQQEESTK